MIGSRVLDATKYLGLHPGGSVVIERLAGRDATQAYKAARHSHAAAGARIEARQAPGAIVHLLQAFFRQKHIALPSNLVRLLALSSRTHGQPQLC